MNDVAGAPNTAAFAGARAASVVWSRRRVFWLSLDVPAGGGWLQSIKFGAVCAVLLTLGVTGVLSARMPSKGLSDQRTDGAEIVSQLEPGQTDMLVLSQLANASKYTNLDHGKDAYLDQVEPGGFAGWFERLKDQRPKIVMISRTKNLDRKEAFLAWLISDYKQRTAGAFTYYVRNDR